MQRKICLVILLALLCTASFAVAGIPLPDAVLYGRLFVDGRPVTAGEDVTIIARVDGVPNPVGVFRMSESASGTDDFVLRLRLEVAIPGSPVGGNAAQLGQTVHICVQEGQGPCRFARDYVITGIGTYQQIPLVVSAIPGNCVPGDPTIELDDVAVFQTCFSGPGGSVSPTCACADLNNDDHVDLADWKLLQVVLTGPGP